MLKFEVIVSWVLLITSVDAILYDNFGNILSENQLQKFNSKNNTKYCTVNIKTPCDTNEWRRIDGSCNNLKHPSIGTVPSANIRVLEPVFSPNYEPVKMKCGTDYPLARYCRTSILKTGKSYDLQITILVSYFLHFVFSDINTIHDSQNLSFNNTECCSAEGRKKYTCIPNIIPINDPVHRFSGVRCMNLTRPLTFQSYGCVENGTKYSRITFTTPLLDMSPMYNNKPGNIDLMRTFSNGLLKTEIENGKIFLPSNGPSDPNGYNNPRSNICLNPAPRETRCHKYTQNNLLGFNILTILFYRLHNLVAGKLHDLNPCWDDDKLFYTARDIIIAIVVQIYYYEFLPVLFGRRNLIRDGVLSCSDGFRDQYDENVLPQITDEFVYMHRYFHVMQESTLKRYDKNGTFLNTFPLANCTTRTGMLPLDDNMEKFIQGSFRQVSGGFERSLDYDMANRVLGLKQFTSDVATSDLAKGRYFGFQSYVKYRESCSKKTIKSYNDLNDVLSEKKLHQLKELYDPKDPIDIELLAGVWLEKKHPGSRVPKTLYCLMVDQFKRFIVSDRHWYERQHRPHAFTLDQLRAIRNMTIARVLCTVGDGVTQIQPKAFYSISDQNPLVECCSSRIKELNLSPWKNPECRN